MTTLPKLALTLFVALAGCQEPGRPTVRTKTLQSPEDTVSAFEPFAVIDQASPDRIYVGAQYGPGYNRGGMRIWNWSSHDGGTTWTPGARVISKVFPPAGQALAADLTMVVGPDGTVHHLSLTADSAPTGLMTAAAVLARSTDGGVTFSPRFVFGTVEASTPGVMTFTDKSWLSGDYHTRSPGRGNLYFGWSRNRVDFRDTSVTTSPAFAVSRDGGASIDSVISLSTQGFGVTIAVRTDGIVDAAWYELRPGGSEGARVLHASSRDQGRTFGPAEVVAHVADTTQSIELPQITVGPRNRLLLCWTQGVPKPGERVDVWCNTRASDGAWSSPRAVLSDSSSGVIYAFPATAATDDAFWLMAYRADTSLDVDLHRSVDGVVFTKIATLASSDIAKTGFCPRPGLPCRRSDDAFFPGDYVSLGGSARRLVAAYGMPRQDGPAGSSTIMVSVIDP